MRELEPVRQRNDNWNYRPERTDLVDIAEGIAELMEVIDVDDFDGGELDDLLWEMNPIEQGMYDDDPSPYAGNYSEE